MCIVPVTDVDKESDLNCNTQQVVLTAHYRRGILVGMALRTRAANQLTSSASIWRCLVQSLSMFNGNGCKTRWPFAIA